MNYTYIVECSDGTLYTGWTNDLDKRILAHNAGKGAKYTKTRTPVVLVYREAFASKQEAMRREYQIKQLTKSQKMKLIVENPIKPITENDGTDIQPPSQSPDPVTK